ncbi:MAG: hypothetical protein ACI4KG_01680 [Oscillospiraceae bacterium]
MNGYMEMLIEYKRSEAALRERIGQINVMLKGTLETIEREDLLRRKSMLEQELYDMLDVIGEIYDYAGCGVDEQCRNA